MPDLIPRLQWITDCPRRIAILRAIESGATSIPEINLRLGWDASGLLSVAHLNGYLVWRADFWGYELSRAGAGVLAVLRALSGLPVAAGWEAVEARPLVAEAVCELTEETA